MTKKKVSNKKVENKVVENNKSKNKEIKSKKISENKVETKKVDTKKSEKKVSETKKTDFKNDSVPTSSGSNEMSKLVKIVLVLVVVIVVFYGITVLVTKYKKNNADERNNEVTPAIIQYDEIILGTLLNRSAAEYYVLVKKMDDPYNVLYSSYITAYQNKLNSLKVYTADLDNVFNQFYIADVSNLNTNDMSKFRVSQITLIKVSNHEVVEAYEGMESIEEAFKQMIK